MLYGYLDVVTGMHYRATMKCVDEPQRYLPFSFV